MDNRERIMQQAEELFYSKGYDAAGVQEIVDRAGVTKPTLYYYFGSKRGLLQALLEEKFRRLRPQMGAAIGEPEGIREKLYRMAGIYYRFFVEEYKFYMLLMALFYSAHENEAYQTVKPYLTDFYQAVVRVFEKASDELGNMNGRQRQFAITFIGSLSQYLVLSHDGETGENTVSEEQVYELVNQFMHGIFS